jgi:hypothetical protein
VGPPRRTPDRLGFQTSIRRCRYDTPEIIMRFGPTHYDGLPSPVQKPGSELFPVTPDFTPSELHVVRAGFLGQKGGPKRPPRLDSVDWYGL